MLRGRSFGWRGAREAGAKDVEGHFAGSGGGPEEEAAGEDAQGLGAVCNRGPAHGQPPKEGVAGEDIGGSLQQGGRKMALEDAPGQQGRFRDAAAGLGLVVDNQAPAEVPFAKEEVRRDSPTIPRRMRSAAPTLFWSWRWSRPQSDLVTE